MFKKSSYWVKSGFFTLFERFSLQIFGFGSAFMLFRVLTQAEMGIWVIFLTIVAIVEVARIGLMQNALIKYLSTAKGAEYGKITLASLFLNVILTVFMVAGFLGLGALCERLFNAPGLGILLNIYALTTVLLVPFFLFNFIQQANLNFQGIFWSNFVRQGLLFLFILYLFLQKIPIELVELAKVQVVTAIIASLVSWWFARPYLRFSSQLDWQWVTTLFNFGKYVFGTNLSTQLYRSIDKMMLGSLSGAVGVSLYEAAIKVTNLAETPTHSMANMLFPQSARRFEEGNHAVGELYEKAVGAIMTLMIPGVIFVLLFAEFIVTLVAGSDYLPAANLLRITILFSLFTPFAVQFGTVLDSIGKPKVNFYFTLFSMLLNIVCNYIFISTFGVIGAAYGTLFTYVITFVLMQIILSRKLGVQTLRVFHYTFVYYKKVWSLVSNQLKPVEARK